ncbi:hypothetical protein M758_12G025100 [Ceratodon purpureus]|nr:hypothetical protein M758_12G025100 [Ceratodon purpureus]
MWHRTEVTILLRRTSFCKLRSSSIPTIPPVCMLSKTKSLNIQAIQKVMQILGYWRN